VTDRTIELDEHRGMMAQKATELRRLLAEVEADERALRVRQEELEAHLVAAPASSWCDAAEKVRYLLELFAATPAAQDPRRQRLIANVLDDFTRLCSRPTEGTSSKMRATWRLRNRKEITVALSFPNRSRFYDATRSAVRFWGHDSAMERSFFVTEDSLKRLQPNMRFDETGLLAAFDLNRDLIQTAATMVYARGRKASYDLVVADF